MQGYSFFGDGGSASCLMKLHRDTWLLWRYVLLSDSANKATDLIYELMVWETSDTFKSTIFFTTDCFCLMIWVNQTFQPSKLGVYEAVHSCFLTSIWHLQHFSGFQEGEGSVCAVSPVCVWRMWFFSPSPTDVPQLPESIAKQTLSSTDKSEIFLCVYLLMFYDRRL